MFLAKPFHRDYKNPRVFFLLTLSDIPPFELAPGPGLPPSAFGDVVPLSPNMHTPVDLA